MNGKKAKKLKKAANAIGVRQTALQKKKIYKRLKKIKINE